MYFKEIIRFFQQEWTALTTLLKDAEEEKRSEANMSKGMVREVLGHNFSVLLGLASVIATFGLLSNSAATIIGAMIVAPLMIPIISFAYSIVVFNFRLLNYSLVRLIYGIVLTVLLAAVSTELIGFRIPGSEILARTEPTLLDMGVAVAAGTAGAFAKIRRSVSDAIPGVAIAVALVPPLCVVGIGLAISDTSLSTGSFYLFLTNLIGIILSAAIVFLCHSYGSWKRAAGLLGILVAGMLLISSPLNFGFREMIAENRIRHALYPYDIRYSEDGESYLSTVQVEYKDEEFWVTLDVISTLENIREGLVNDGLETARERISDIVGDEVNLRVRYLPVEILDYEVSAPPEAEEES